MLGEVIKFIMRIADIVNWFIKPRLQIKSKEEPKEDNKWTEKKQKFWNDKLGKNPAYKSSQGF
jgi:hypothetical protein